jgi:hypothetical protein
MAKRKKPKLIVNNSLSNSCSFGLRYMPLFSNLNHLQGFDKISSGIFLRSFDRASKQISL